MSREFEYEQLVQPPEHIIRASNFVDAVKELADEDSDPALFVESEIYQLARMEAYELLLNPPPMYEEMNNKLLPIDRLNNLREYRKRISDKAEREMLDFVEVPVHLFSFTKSYKKLLEEQLRMEHTVKNVRILAERFESANDEANKKVQQIYELEADVYATEFNAWYTFTPKDSG